MTYFGYVLVPKNEPFTELHVDFLFRTFIKDKLIRVEEDFLAQLVDNDCVEITYCGNLLALVSKYKKVFKITSTCMINALKRFYELYPYHGDIYHEWEYIHFMVYLELLLDESEKLHM